MTEQYYKTFRKLLKRKQKNLDTVNCVSTDLPEAMRTAVSSLRAEILIVLNWARTCSCQPQRTEAPGASAISATEDHEELVRR